MQGCLLGILRKSLPYEDSHIMCKFELITFQCGQQVHRRFSYCHLARNDPLITCFGIQMLKSVRINAQNQCDNTVYGAEESAICESKGLIAVFHE